MVQSWGQEVWYHYDVENPEYYWSFNNRLMYEELRGSMTQEVLSTTYYEYSADGNVTRVITEHPAILSPPMESMMSGGETELLEGSATAPAVEQDGEEVMAAGGGGGTTGCTAPKELYTATRFEYAKNGETVTYVLGESWCSDGDRTGQNCSSTNFNEVVTNYQALWAREFRYDGARARYMNRQLNPSNLATVATTWSDYDGDEIYGDFEIVSGSPVNKRSFEPGMARTANPLTTPATDYYHSDMLGTTRLMSTSPAPPGAPTAIEPAVYTAFGERIGGPTVSDGTRYGYAGAWGYQSHSQFPYLHIGARYYDPSSGRFLQRDRIGIRGGINVFGYVGARPTNSIDPFGLFDVESGFVNGIIGGVGGGFVGGLPGAIVGGVGGFVGGGWEPGDAEGIWNEFKQTLDAYIDRNRPKPPRPPRRNRDPWFCTECKRLRNYDEVCLHAG